MKTLTPQKERFNVSPELGEIRYVSFFAWKPRKIEGRLIWMRRYWVKQQYQGYSTIEYYTIYQSVFPSVLNNWHEID